MNIRIPEHLKEDFLSFLDIAQSNFTEDDLHNFSESELEVLKIVGEILFLNGIKPSKRYENFDEKHRSAREFCSILGASR